MLFPRAVGPRTRVPLLLYRSAAAALARRANRFAQGPLQGEGRLRPAFHPGHHAAEAALPPADHEGDAASAAGERQPQGHPGHQQGAQPGDGVQALPGSGAHRRAVRPAWPGDTGLPRGDGQQVGRPPEHRQHHRSGEGETVRQGEEGGIPRTGARREEGAQEERIARGEGASRAEGAGGTEEARIPI